MIEFGPTPAVVDAIISCAETALVVDEIGHVGVVADVIGNNISSRINFLRK